jgi:hypothetical protein
VAGSLEIEDYLRDTLGIRADELPPLFGSLVHFPLPPPTFKSTRLEMRRVLLGTGLVVGLDEFDWLVKNVDLASPYPALRFLDQLASRARSSGISGSPALEAELDSFLATTEAFADFVHRLQRKSRELPGAKAALEEALDRLAATSEEVGLALDTFREPLSRSRSREADALVAWLIENFPIRHEGDHVRFASRLFRRWWLRQITAPDGQEVTR